MHNSFFENSLDQDAIKQRILSLEDGKVGFYSIGLYPGSIAYNCAMQTDGKFLRLATRPGRTLMGAFSKDAQQGMDPDHVETLQRMAVHEQGSTSVPNTLTDLINTCDLVVLSANSNHIEQDVQEACALRTELNREQVVLACLAGSFSHDFISNESYVLCEKQPNLAFFSGFHRHGALRNPLDSFTANFCHPNALTALLGARMMDKLSPNIQVSPGIHNVEAQYIKAAKNMSSIFAGFGYTYHRENTGTLPTLLTLLLDQCIDQAATVSMSRHDRQQIYNRQPIALTELGYGVQRIEATLSRGGDMEKVRDHTFAQLTAMVADVRGSMLMPVSGHPTRNFQAGQVLAEMMLIHQRCPRQIEELEEWCEKAGLRKGGLEGLKALRYWPQIVRKYDIQVHDASMVNLLYMLLYGKPTTKEAAFSVMTESRELSNYCQESVRPTHSRKYAEALQNLDKPEALDLLANAVVADNARQAINDDSFADENDDPENVPPYLKMMNVIENVW
ncbi:hypothetical protein IQ260_11120 [Leptolyngbya cf. ectocarpi LEGE 11479]|uniref:Uncharacterized protein n=1 Tax=Leptolyngbya cf. ectocarpi LEGE 11479 TaxID=1828722 RepID=A0A928X1I9_LEPEC|nr:hypothetical protein [Leptolyngbya ectocarpi]MBE9067207.1 hypothetical protein [Leptolyngbya cf. ectocarpi LEGE 11479]